MSTNKQYEPPFHFEELGDCAVKMFYALADRLDEIKPGVGEKLVGFPPEAGKSYFDMEAKPEVINSGDTALFAHLQMIHSYAFGLNAHEVEPGGLDEAVVKSFLEVIPSRDFDGEAYVFSPKGNLVETVLETAFARYKLDHPVKGDYMTVPELALLAGMKEGSVRNQISSSDTVKYASGKAGIPHNKALKWLKERRGFRETPQYDPLGFFAAFIPAAENLPELAAEIGKYVEAAKKENILKKSDLTVLKTWTQAENIRPDLKTAVKLAKIIGIDPAHFAGRVVELCLRHEMNENEEDI